jgi:hypothetical protein
MLHIPELAGNWTTLIYSAGSFWRGPERNFPPEVLVPAIGELRLAAHSFLAVERSNSEAM